MAKDLEYYLRLPYRIEYVEIPEEEGGGVELSMPELGSAVVLGYGKTVEEARTMLKEVQREVLSDWLAKSSPIPEPDCEREYSGKFMLRLPPRLHRRLAENARRDQVSLNQYVALALTEYTTSMAQNWLFAHKSAGD